MSEPTVQLTFVQRTPEFYRHVATNVDDTELVRACLRLAADDIDRWRLSVDPYQQGEPIVSA